MSDTPGYYNGTFESASTDQLGEKKTPFLCLMFNVTQGAQNGAWVALGEPMRRTVRFCISDGVWASTTAKRILSEGLAAMGFNGDFANPQFNGAILQGPVTLEAVANGEYTNWRIDGLGGSGAEAKPINNDLARTLNAKYAAAQITMTPPSVAPTPPQAPYGQDQTLPGENGTPPDPNPPTGDGIPY